MRKVFELGVFRLTLAGYAFRRRFFFLNERTRRIRQTNNVRFCAQNASTVRRPGDGDADDIGGRLQQSDVLGDLREPVLGNGRDDQLRPDF